SPASPTPPATSSASCPTPSTPSTPSWARSAAAGCSNRSWAPVSSLVEGPVSPGHPPGVPRTPPHRQLGLTDEELERILSVLGRGPGGGELGMDALVWGGD